jgi:hypothetical protein
MADHDSLTRTLRLPLHIRDIPVQGIPHFSFLHFCLLIELGSSQSKFVRFGPETQLSLRLEKA